jgi:hypothetical protein
VGLLKNHRSRCTHWHCRLFRDGWLSHEKFLASWSTAPGARFRSHTHTASVDAVQTIWVAAAVASYRRVWYCA